MKENIPLQLNEEIVPIIGYEGLYSITSFGRVWSHEKIRKGENNSQRTYKGKFLKSDLIRGGYLRVVLCEDYMIKRCLVHRLGAIAFILNPLNDPQVNHKDTNKQNNYVGTAAKNYKDGNLEWCTNQKNMNHAMENGLHKKETSRYYGVYCHKGFWKKPWIARTTINKKQIHIGLYPTEIEAAKAYNEFVLSNNLDRPLNKI
jgi:hypothetical protein